MTRMGINWDELLNESDRSFARQAAPMARMLAGVRDEFVEAGFSRDESFVLMLETVRMSFDMRGRPPG